MADGGKDNNAKPSEEISVREVFGIDMGCEIAVLDAVFDHIANAPSSPTNARIITAELTNDTTLRWDASPESDTAGYEVLWRATTDYDWKKIKDVGNTTEATIDLSKDNWIFAVRAYDKDGYRSPATYPTPSRE